MTVMFAAVWFATADPLPTVILVLFGRALWLGTTAIALGGMRGISGNACQTRFPNPNQLTSLSDDRNFHVLLR